MSQLVMMECTFERASSPGGITALLVVQFGESDAHNQLMILQAFVLCITPLLYNLCLHPLHSYAGPWYARASIVPYTYWLVTGELTNAARMRHFGIVVR